MLREPSFLSRKFIVRKLPVQIIQLVHIAMKVLTDCMKISIDNFSSNKYKNLYVGLIFWRYNAIENSTI